MKLRDYIGGMTEQELADYAQRCSTTPNYLSTHIRYATKDPSVKLIRTLARESGGVVSISEVLEHYRLTDAVQKAA